MSVVYIALGAMLGAIARWLIGVYLNPLWGAMSLGVLAVNYIGCFVMGICLALSLSNPVKLFLITGFLGSFTTFSAFSADMMNALLQGKYTHIIMILLWHNIGGIILMCLGFYCIKLLK